MICGIEWVTKVSKKQAYKLSKQFDLEVKKGYKTRREIRLKDQPDTWKRSGEHNHFFIEVRKTCSKQYILSVRGSLHKFYHGNNSGFFKLIEVQSAIDGMCRLFDIKPEDAVIKSLEVGVNLHVWFNVSVGQYLFSNLGYHKKKIYEKTWENKKGFEYIYNDYNIKIYEKDSNILRFEIKYKSPEKLMLFGISTISHLNQININKLVDSLIPEWQEVVMRDGIDMYSNDQLLTEEEHTLLTRYTSHFYQQSFKDQYKSADCKKQAAMRQAAARTKKKCLDIIASKGNGDHKRIMQKMEVLISEFKTSWLNEGVGDEMEMSHFPMLDKEKESVTLNFINNAGTEDCNKNNYIMIKEKGKKTRIINKRREKEQQFQSFLKGLGITLNKIEENKIIYNQKSIVQ